MIYIVIAVFFFLNSYIFDVKGVNKNWHIAFWVEFLLLFLLAGLRYRIGTDSFIYSQMYERIPNLFNINFQDIQKLKFEPIWTIYCSFLKVLSPDFILLQLVNAFIVTFAIFKITKKYAVYPFSVILFYFAFDYLVLNFEFMRQSLAVAVFLLIGFPLLQKKKWIFYLIVVTICFNIHMTAAIAYLFPFLSILKLTPKKGFFYISFLILISLIFSSIFQQIGYFLDLSDSLMAGKLSHYSGFSNTHNLFFYLSRWYIPIFCGFIILVFNRKSETTDQFENFIYVFMFCAVLSSYADILGRFKYFVGIFFLISLSNTFISLIKKNIRERFIFMTFLFILLIPTTIVELNHQYDGGYRFYQKFYPYYSVFNPQRDKDRESQSSLYKSMW